MRALRQPRSGGRPRGGDRAAGGGAKHWSLSEPTLLIHYVHASSARPRSYALGPVVSPAARNDLAARSLLEEAARELARHVDAVVRGFACSNRRWPGGGCRATGLRAVLAQVKAEVGPVKYVMDPSQGAVTARAAAERTSEVTRACARRRRPRSCSGLALGASIQQQRP
jgi:N-acetylglucosamine kinase-like BadF-type ATPase